MELTGPNTSMKRSISLTSHFTGPTTVFRIDVIERDRDLGHVVDQVVEQDLDRQHRQERQDQRGSGHAEHVAEIRACTHQDIFGHVLDRAAPGRARLREPRDRSCSSRIRSAAARATSAAPSTEIPTSAACSAGASLMPSPMKPTTWPRRFSASRTRSFCCGLTRQNRLVPGQLPEERLLVRSVQRLAGQHARHGNTDFREHMAGDTVRCRRSRTFTVMPACCHVPDRRAGARLRRIQEDREAGEDHIGFIGDHRAIPVRRPAVESASGSRSPARGSLARRVHRASP